MRFPIDYPAKFRVLLQSAEVPIGEIAASGQVTVAGGLSPELADILRGLAIAMDSSPRQVASAALIVGLETLVGHAEKLGYYGQKKAD